MKSWFTASFLCIIPTAGAFAADLPSRREPPTFVAPVMLPPPVFSWTGFYLGGNAGYAFDANQRFVANGNDGLSNALIAAGIAPNYIRTRSQGFTGGAQIGYNFELGGSILGGSFLGGGLVAGVEADAAYTRLHGETDYLSAGTITTARTSVDFVGTARGRLGLAYQNILVYGTGGFAYGGVNDSVTATAPGIGLAYGGRSDRIRTGYAYGGGVEFAIPTSSFLNVFKSSAVTLKAEFIHYDLGPASAVIGGAGALAGSSFTVRGRADGNLVRAGVNYKFDTSGTPAAVVARY